MSNYNVILSRTTGSLTPSKAAGSFVYIEKKMDGFKDGLVITLKFSSKTES